MADRRYLYFNAFPVTNYRGYNAINIMSRVELSEATIKYFKDFYPHTITREENVDSIAFDYYGSVNFDWLIYHTNNIIDPYYGQPINDIVFDDYIRKKYGSIRAAERKILFYESNWRNDDSVISVAQYNLLSPNYNSDGTNDGSDPDFVANLKSYWEEIRNVTGVMGYRRRKEDKRYSTNRTFTISTETTMDEPLAVGDILETQDNSRATVLSSNTSFIVCHHVIGNWARNANFEVDTDSGKTITLDSSSYSLLRQVIPQQYESIYYRPVSAYEYEERINEDKRDIQLIDSSFSEPLFDQFKRLMK